MLFSSEVSESGVSDMGHGDLVDDRCRHSHSPPGLRPASAFDDRLASARRESEALMTVVAGAKVGTASESGRGLPLTIDKVTE